MVPEPKTILWFVFIFLAFHTAQDVDEAKSESSWTALAKRKERDCWSIDLEGEVEKLEVSGPWSETKGNSVDPKGKMGHKVSSRLKWSERCNPESERKSDLCRNLKRRKTTCVRHWQIRQEEAEEMGSGGHDNSTFGSCSSSLALHTDDAMSASFRMAQEGG